MPPIAATCRRRCCPPIRGLPAHERFTRFCSVPASGRGARGRHRDVGVRGARQRHPALCAAGTGRGVPDPGQRLAGAFGIARRHPADHAGRVHRRGDRWRRLGVAVQSVEMAGIFAVSLCGDPASHAGDCDRAATADLSPATDRRHSLRLDRRLLPGAVEHHARAQFGRPQPGRPVQPVWRVADADAAVSEIAGSATLHPRWIADRRWAIPDRRGGRRNCGRYGRCRLGPRLPHRGVRLSPQHSPNVRRAVVALRRRDCHLWSAGANFTSGTAALARKRASKGKLMAAGNISSEKIDLLVYGPIRPILENGFSDQFVLHKAESRADLERLTPDVLAKTRGMAVTYHTVPADGKAQAHFPKLEIIASFGVGYDHVDSTYAREHNIVVTNTPDVLTEEVADVAMGLLISTLREFVKADRYLRSGLWQTQNYPLSVGSLRDRKIGIVGMGRIGQAIGRRLDASRVPVVYHSRNPAAGVSYKHYGDLIEMAKAVDTLVVIVPGGASTAKMINAEVMTALGPRGVIINVARGTVVDEPALVAALKSGTIRAAGLDVFEREPNVP